ncbi:MAG: VWA domain-containing protein, partial [Planctomycetaceae bacterium]|nr:VWA domain-containing protein [Planctomycetaceae bacterium]
MAPAAEDSPWKTRQSPERPVDTGRQKRALWAVALLGGLAAFVAILLWLPRPTPLLLLAVTDYHEPHSPGEFLVSPWPPNAWAAQDVKAFATDLKNTHVKMQPIGDTATSPSRESFRQALESIDALPGGPNKDVILLYLSAHTLVNRDGRPCLLLSGADVLDESTWLRFDDFADDIAKISPHGKKAKKVVFLDCGRVTDDRALGFAQNEFAHRVQQTAAREDVWVILSHSAGEQTWTIPEWGQTPFGLAVKLVLDGNVPLTQNGGRYLTLEAAASGVQSAVSEWVKQWRGRAQTPLLWGPEQGRDFPIARVPSAPAGGDVVTLEPVDKLIPPERDARLAALSEGLSGSIDFAATSPHAIARCRRLRSQLEELLIAGPTYNPLWDDLKRELEKENGRIRSVASSQNRVAAQWEEVWQRLISAELPTRQLLSEELASLEHLTEPLPIQVHFARMLRDYVDWDNPASKDLVSHVVRQSLTCRHLAEIAAHPQDARTVPWVRQRVNAGDEQRRRGEDHLFVGTQSDLEQAQRDLAAAHEHYQSAATVATDIQTAFALRDQLLIDVVAFRSVLPRIEGSRKDAVYVDWLKAVAALDESLRTPRISGSDGPSVDEGHRQVKDASQQARRLTEENREMLRAQIDKYSGRTSPARASIQELLPALLIEPADQVRLRARLREQFEARDQTAAVRFPVATAAETASPSGSEATASNVTGERPEIQPVIDQEQEYLQLVHRFVRQLNTSDLTFEPAARNDNLHALGGRVRDAVRTYLRFFDRHTLAGVDNLGSMTTDDVIDRLQQADALIRLMSAGIAAQSAPASPAETWREIEAARQELWLAERTLDDFWGSGPRPSSNSEPYFVKQANRELAGGLRTAREGVRKLLQPEHRRLEERLAVLKNSANASMPSVSSTDVGFRTDAGHPISHNRSQRDGGVITLQVNEDPRRPQGPAFVEVTSSPERSPVLLGNVRRMGVGLSEQSVNQQLDAGGAFSRAADWKDTTLTARTFFRGHVHESRFRVREAMTESRDLTFERVDYDDAHITVDGSLDVQPVILFVLDCSGSMSNQMPGEGGTRMSRARQVIRNILDQLAAQDGLHLGLMAYGHRFTWPGQGSGRPLSERAVIEGRLFEGDKSKFATDHERDLQEFSDLVKTWNQDVQLIVPLAPIGRGQQVSTLRDRLNELEPWGQTPLYLAIRKAVSTVQNYQQQQPAQIIVITDGMDDLLGSRVTEQLKDGNSERDRQAARELIARLNQNRLVRMDVIEIFDDPLTQNANQKQAQDERKKHDVKAEDLKELIGNFGNYQIASSTRSLEQRLQEILKPIQFTVSSGTNGEPLDLGETVRVPLKPSIALEPRHHDVVDVALTGVELKGRAVSSSVFLEGGERLQLTVDRTGTAQTVQWLLRHRGFPEEGVNALLPRARAPRPETARGEGPQSALVMIHP